MHILFTRPLEDCHELISKFQSLGHTISHLPLIEIESLKYENFDQIFLWFLVNIFYFAQCIIPMM